MSKPKITLREISQEISLKAEGLKGLSRAIKESIAQALIDKIVERTESGEKFGGGDLKKPYSKGYARSLEFKAAGKSKNKIDMKLTGDMLASIDVISVAGDKIKIGIKNESEIPKAYNHNVGDTVPKRPFFGVTETEVKEVLSKFTPSIREDLSGDLTPTQRKALAVLDQISEGEDV